MLTSKYTVFMTNTNRVAALIDLMTLGAFATAPVTITYALHVNQGWKELELSFNTFVAAKQWFERLTEEFGDNFRICDYK
jgi:hypothetical protein